MVEAPSLQTFLMTSTQEQDASNRNKMLVEVAFRGCKRNPTIHISILDRPANNSFTATLINQQTQSYHRRRGEGRGNTAVCTHLRNSVEPQHCTSTPGNRILGNRTLSAEPATKTHSERHPTPFVATRSLILLSSCQWADAKWVSTSIIPTSGHILPILLRRNAFRISMDNPKKNEDRQTSGARSTPWPCQARYLKQAFSNHAREAQYPSQSDLHSTNCLNSR